LVFCCSAAVLRTSAPTHRFKTLCLFSPIRFALGKAKKQAVQRQKRSARFFHQKPRVFQKNVVFLRQFKKENRRFIKEVLSLQKALLFDKRSFFDKLRFIKNQRFFSYGETLCFLKRSAQKEEKEEVDIFCAFQKPSALQRKKQLRFF
jgi:hypothetical protein